MRELIAPYSHGFIATIIGAMWLDFATDIAITILLGLVGGFFGILGRYLGQKFLDYIKLKFGL